MTRSTACAARSPTATSWGLVNVNLRPFYAEGSKTFGYEIAEQLGWRTPQHVVAPMAGGSLIGKIHKAFDELHKLGLIDEPHCKILRRPGDRLQPDHRRGQERSGHASPGSPARRRSPSRWRSATRPTATSRSRSCARPAAGARMSATRKLPTRCCCWPAPKASSPRRPAASRWRSTKKLIEQGRIPRDEEIVICVTGNGLKTQDAIADLVAKPIVIRPSMEEFEAVLAGGEPALV